LLHVDAVGWIMIHVKSEEEGEQNPADTRDGNHILIICLSTIPLLIIYAKTDIK